MKRHICRKASDGTELGPPVGSDLVAGNVAGLVDVTGKVIAGGRRAT